MPGLRIPNSPIAVDYWKYGDNLRFYFLTHAHADHTSGLTPSWNYGTIYCSPVSSLLLQHKLNVKPEIIVRHVFCEDADDS